MLRRVQVLGLMLALLAACSGDDGDGDDDGPAPVETPTTGEVAGRLTPFRGASQSAAVRAQAARSPGMLAAARAAAVRSLPRSGASTQGERLAPVGGRTGVVPGEFIVRYEDGPAQAARLSLAGMRVALKAQGPRGMQLVRVTPEGAQAQAALADPEAAAVQVAAQLARQPGVRWAEPNRWMQRTAVPDDRYYTTQWHYPAMNLTAAWDLTAGSASVVVAVIDTGIRSHPDLPRTGGRVLAGYDFISDAANAGDGNGRDSDPTDQGGDAPNGGSSWHGTHVAGTIGATSNNGSGVAGVDWRARILPVRVLGREGGTSFDIVAAMDWAAGGSVSGVPANPNPAQVVNLSLGGPGAVSQAYTDVVSRHPDTVFVVAAGNSNEPAEGFSPCNTPGLVCVGSTAFSSRRSSFSNYGPAVDVMGAGGELREDLNGDGYPDGVLSTSFDENGEPVFAFENGTSMASPHVAGVVSLMLAARRERDGASATLSGADAERLLKATASPTPGCTEGCGAGLVNAGAAVARALNDAPSGPARLSTSAQSLFFPASGTQALSLYNQGAEPLTATLSVQAGTLPADRVTLTPAGSVTVGPGSSAQVQVAVRADGLAPGDYAATLAVGAGTAGSASVALRLRVGEAGQDKDAVIAFAYLDNAGEWQVDEEGVGLVSAAQAYEYVIELTPREYFVLATIDDDGDGEFFEEDSDRIGFWRNVDEFEPVTVVAGERVDNVSFDLVPLKPVEAPSEQLLVGAPCTGDADCPEGGACITSWPNGYCTRECASQACPGASTCLPFTTEGGDTVQLCAQDCVGAGSSSDSCREGYACTALLDGSGGQRNACYPE